MKSIASYVESEILQDDVAFGALQQGILNYSQYAQGIRSKIEEKRLEPVSLASIVTALSRLATQYQLSVLPHTTVSFDQVSIRPHLSEVTFRRDSISPSILFDWYVAQSPQQTFFEVTMGVSEITCITSSDSTKEIIAQVFPIVPLVVLTDLVGITFRFSEKYFDEPAVLYSILRVFALEKISIVEFVSTYQEATVVCYEKDLDHVLQTIKRFFYMKAM